MKKTCALILALSMLLAAAASAEGRLGFLLPAADSSFSSSCIEGANSAAEARSYALEILTPESEDDYAALAGLLEDAVAGGILGVAVCGIDPETLKPAIQRANEAGIPVVLFNTVTAPNGAEAYACVGCDQYDGGARIADWVNEKTGGEAGVAIVEGLPSDATAQRLSGFVDRCAEMYPGVSVAASQSGNWSRGKSMDAALDMLQAHPEISVLYCLSDEMALGAVDACRQLNREDILCIGIGGSPAALELVASGELAATLDCHPADIGAQAVQALIEAVDGAERSDKIVRIDAAVVDADVIGASTR